MMGSAQRKFNVSNEPVMNDDTAPRQPEGALREERPPLTPAARRAIAEAEARRTEALAREAAAPKEIGGRGGNDPARYGDWEVKGMASDF